MSRTIVGFVVLAVCTTAAVAADAFPPPELAAKLKEDPKTDADKGVKAAIENWQAKLDAIKADKPEVAKALPFVRRKLLPLYREYNADKKRYRQDHFTPEECLKRLESDMTFTLEALSAGKDPYLASSGRWQTRVAWIERTEMMGHYDVIVPTGYDPAKSWPVIVSFQDDPDMNQTRKAGYFLIRAIQKGYPTGLTYVENKTRSYLKETAREYNIDPTRVYATAFSYGGHTDLVIAWRFPHWFAAIAPVCSDLRDNTTPFVSYLQNVPTLLLHGTGDSFLNSGKVVHKFMEDAKCPVQWQTYPGGHTADGIFRGDTSILTNFFAKHTMDPYPKTVSHVVEHSRYTRAFWVNAVLVEPSLASAAFVVTVKPGNVIEVKTEKVVVESPTAFKTAEDDRFAALELYLTDKLVDMAKPVKVVRGDKTLFEGPAAAKVVVNLLENSKAADQGPGDTLWQDIEQIKAASVYAK